MMQNNKNNEQEDKVLQ